MPKDAVIIDNKFLEKYSRGATYKAYERAVDINDHLTFHFDGYDAMWAAKDQAKNNSVTTENPYFTRLIDTMRPSENVQIKLYRRSIYLAITKPTCFKIYNSLKKIVKSPDWKIDYAKTKKIPRIPEDESLEKYCEQKYPRFKSIENWAYTFGLRQLLIDPNALVVVLPTQFEKEANDYYKPVARVVPSRMILDIKNDEYIIYKSDEKYEYKDTNGALKEGDIIHVLTPDSVFVCEQRDETRNYTITEYPHNIGHIPAWLMGGNILKEINDVCIYESFISPVLPSLDAAARESSDLDAEVVQHIFSTMWYYSSQECPDCRGVGRVNKNGRQVVCATCEGNGAFKKSPYKDISVKPPDKLDGAGAVPTPPAGYIIKPTEIVKIQDERIQNHLVRALSAINMEFLATQPLNQSGVAKEVDRDELNNFVYSIAYHLVENILRPIYFFVNEWRNGEIVPDKVARVEMLPRINVPEKFNLLTENVIQEQLMQARKAEVSDDIISYLELDYINIKFANYPELRDKILAIKSLDPLATKTPTEKSDLLLAGVITKFDMVKSSYIDYFVDCAIEDDEKFLELETDAQEVIIDKYTADKLAELDGQQGTGAVQKQIEDPNKPGFDMTGQPMVQVEDVNNPGYDMSGKPMTAPAKPFGK